MHIQTHLLCGWCIGNGFRLTPRERLFCMVVSIAPDVDGISRIFGQNAYFDWHHVLAHNLCFCLLISGILAYFSTHRLKAFTLYFALAHLHLLMDYFGSGPGWGIAYFWPFSKWQAISQYAWEFSSWQNRLCFLVFFLWVLAIARWDKRTPMEALMPSLDRQLVAILSRGT